MKVRNALNAKGKAACAGAPFLLLAKDVGAVYNSAADICVRAADAGAVKTDALWRICAKLRFDMRKTAV